MPRIEINEIEVIILVDGFPVVKIDGKRLPMNDGRLSRLRDAARKIIEDDFQNIKSIRAFDGKIIHGTKESPVQNLEQAVSFGMIIIHGLEENNCDHHLIEKIRPFLSLLVWHESEHFKGKNSRLFECLLCGRIDLGIEKPKSLYCSPPHRCTNKECFSHQMEKMLSEIYTQKPQV